MKRSVFLRVLLFVVLANFLAQVVYLFHQYHGVPSLTGVLLMLAVFAWFIVGFILLSRHTRAGLIIMLAFLITEFLFYLSTQVTQVMSGQGVLLHVLNPTDVVLFIVFAIGYINFIAAGFFIFYLFRHKMDVVCKK